MYSLDTHADLRSTDLEDTDNGSQRAHDTKNHTGSSNCMHWSRGMRKAYLPPGRKPQWATFQSISIADSSQWPNTLEEIAQWQEVHVQTWHAAFWSVVTKLHDAQA